MMDFNRLVILLIILILSALAYKWIDNQGNWSQTNVSRTNQWGGYNSPNDKYLFNSKTGKYK